MRNGARVKSESSPAPSRKPVRRLVATAQAGRILRLEIFLPIVVISEANTHDHWTARHERNKSQQEQFDFEYLALLGKVTVAPPCRIILTRIGQNEMDSDNLAGSFKHVRDAIARTLGVDDGSPLLTWEYRQICRTPERGIKVMFIAGE